MSVSESDYTATVDSLQLLTFLQLQLHLPYHDRKVSQKATESISERLKLKKFPGGACPHTPLAIALFAHIALGPPTENKEPPHSRIRLRACRVRCGDRNKSITYKRQDRNNWEMNRLGLRAEPAPQPQHTLLSSPKKRLPL